VRAVLSRHYAAREVCSIVGGTEELCFLARMREVGGGVLWVGQKSFAFSRVCEMGEGGRKSNEYGGQALEQAANDAPCSPD